MVPLKHHSVQSPLIMLLLPLPQRISSSCRMVQKQIWTGGITLLDNGGGIGGVTGQRLLSEAVPHTFNVLQMGTVSTLTLPGYNPAASRPTLSNTAGGNVVTGQGGAWEVSGFNISGTTAALPYNTGIFSAGTRGFNINRNSFVLYNRGVDVTNTANGIGIVSENTFSGDGANSLHGARITQNVGTLELAFQNNTATNNLGVVPPGTGTGFEIIANAGTTIDGVGNRRRWYYDSGDHRKYSELKWYRDDPD